jgi:hypothetical protein
MANTPPVNVYIPKKGSIAYFALEGKDIEGAEPVSKTSIPAALVFSDWAPLGCIEDANLLPVEREGGQDIHCWNDETGDWDLIESANINANTKQALEIMFQLVTPFVLQMAWSAADVDAGDGTFVPNSQPGGVYRGWLFMQTKRKGAELESVVKLWVELTMDGPTKLASRTEGHKPKVRVQILGAAANAGTLGTTTA